MKDISAKDTSTKDTSAQDLSAEDISEIVKDTAQKVVNGELSFQQAVDAVLQYLSYDLVHYHYGRTLDKIKELLNEELIKIGVELYIIGVELYIEYIYSVAEKVALKVMNNMMSYGEAVYSILNSLPFKYIKENYDDAVAKAEGLLDDRLLKLEDRYFNIEKTYKVAKNAVSKLKDGEIDAQDVIDSILDTFPHTYIKLHPDEARTLAEDIFEWAKNSN